MFTYKIYYKRKKIDEFKKDGDFVFNEGQTIKRRLKKWGRQKRLSIVKINKIFYAKTIKIYVKDE